MAVTLALFAPAWIDHESIRDMADDQQAQFDQAFAEAAVKRPKAIDPMAPLPHYPQKRYVEKNLAPELNLTYQDVGDLAAARRHAEEQGVLSKELGEHMLPMAMVEGRQGNFGINPGNGFRAVPETLERAKKLGLDYTDMTDPANVEKHRYDFHEDDMQSGTRNYYKKVTIQGPNGPQEAHQIAEGPPQTPLTIDYPQRAAPLPRTEGNKHLMVQGSSAPGSTARMMALMLAEKAAVAKGDVAGAVKGYNGAGPATEQYWAKVQAAKELLAHPKNAKLMQYFNSVYLKGK